MCPFKWSFQDKTALRILLNYCISISVEYNKKKNILVRHLKRALENIHIVSLPSNEAEKFFTGWKTFTYMARALYISSNIEPKYCEHCATAKTLFVQRMCARLLQKAFDGFGG